MQNTKTGRNEKVSYKCIGWLVVPRGSSKIIWRKRNDAKRHIVRSVYSVGIHPHIRSILSPSSNMGDVHYCIKQQSNQPAPLEYRSAKKKRNSIYLRYREDL